MRACSGSRLRECSFDCWNLFLALIQNKIMLVLFLADKQIGENDKKTTV